MTYQEALEYIHSNYWLGSKPGLSRTRELLSKIGNPQEKLSFIHVAGTNGKGSFCAMLASVLKAAGYQVGLFTSPYILSFPERIRVNGENIPDLSLAELVGYIRPFADSMSDKPTEFELITAVAMEYFSREKCDIVVLECGMGGRLDSTNVIPSAKLSVITGISLDHTAYLGSTVKEIAAEKAGIIKKGTPCLFCGTEQEARKVIGERAKKMSAPLITVNRQDLKVKKVDLEGTVLDIGDHTDLFLPLLGVYQPFNALNVVTAVGILQNQGMRITPQALREGLKTVKWPARYEKISQKPLIFFDGGHNPEGVKAAVESTKLYFGNQKLLLVTGMMADKDHKEMILRLSEIAKEAFCVKPDNPRALAAETLAGELIACGVKSTAFSSVSQALSAVIKKAQEQSDAILCVGSLYLYREIVLKLAENGA